MLLFLTLVCGFLLLSFLLDACLPGEKAIRNPIIHVASCRYACSRCNRFERQQIILIYTHRNVRILQKQMNEKLTESSTSAAAWTTLTCWMLAFEILFPLRFEIDRVITTCHWQTMVIDMATRNVPRRSGFKRRRRERKKIEKARNARWRPIQGCCCCLQQVGIPTFPTSWRWIYYYRASASTRRVDPSVRSLEFINFDLADGWWHPLPVPQQATRRHWAERCMHFLCSMVKKKLAPSNEMLAPAPVLSKIKWIAVLYLATFSLHFTAFCPCDVYTGISMLRWRLTDMTDVACPVSSTKFEYNEHRIQSLWMERSIEISLLPGKTRCTTSINHWARVKAKWSFWAESGGKRIWLTASSKTYVGNRCRLYWISTASEIECVIQSAFITRRTPLSSGTSDDVQFVNKNNKYNFVFVLIYTFRGDSSSTLWTTLCVTAAAARTERTVKNGDTLHATYPLNGKILIENLWERVCARRRFAFISQLFARLCFAFICHVFHVRRSVIHLYNLYHFVRIFSVTNVVDVVPRTMRPILYPSLSPSLRHEPGWSQQEGARVNFENINFHSCTAHSRNSSMRERM